MNRSAPNDMLDVSCCSTAELEQAFAQGRIPSALELTGSWVAIGAFLQPAGSHGDELLRVDCAGPKGIVTAPNPDAMVKRLTLESVLLVNGYSVEPRIVGNEWNTRNRQAFKRDGLQSPSLLEVCMPTLKRRKPLKLSKPARRRRNQELQIVAEEMRVTGEHQRTSAEELRQNAETVRESRELSRQRTEQRRVASESQRQTNESTCEEAELLRSAAEDLRKAAELARDTAEAARQAIGAAAALQDELKQLVREVLRERREAK
jgi:hypothetical protein